jgi:hypothetical protein
MSTIVPYDPSTNPRVVAEMLIPVIAAALAEKPASYTTERIECSEPVIRDVERRAAEQFDQYYDVHIIGCDGWWSLAFRIRESPLLHGAFFRSAFPDHQEPRGT